MQSLSLSKCAKRIHAVLILGTVVLGAASIAHAGAAAQQRADGSFRGYDDYTGPYAQLSVSIGRIDFDVDGTDTDNKAAGGFGLTGGYRALPWLSGEFHFQFLGGNQNVKIDGNKEYGQFFAFTFGPKLYPLGLVDVDGMPENVQPYAFVGIGGGEAEIDNQDKSTFAARFILGIDWWIDDHFGLFMEGGGFATDDEDIDGAGVFSLGGQYRF